MGTGKGDAPAAVRSQAAQHRSSVTCPVHKASWHQMSGPAVDSLTSALSWQAVTRRACSGVSWRLHSLPGEPQPASLHTAIGLLCLAGLPLLSQLSREWQSPLVSALPHLASGLGQDARAGVSPL